jgi:predicted HTH domain antitoxin
MDLETILRDFSQAKMGLSAAARLSAMAPSRLRSLLKDRGVVVLEYDADALQHELEAIYQRQAESP